MIRRGAVALAAVALTACTASHSTPQHTATEPAGSSVATVTGPVVAGPTTAAAGATCPYAAKQFVQDTIGMRLSRLTLLSSGGRVVGCRFYALQGSPLHASEHLPGPNQPAVEISTQRYRSAVDAHNAFVLAARAGRNPEPVSLDGTPADCFQTAFDPHDAGADWACGTSRGTRMLLVRTVDNTSSFNAQALTRRVLGAL